MEEYDAGPSIWTQFISCVTLGKTLVFSGLLAYMRLS